MNFIIIFAAIAAVIAIRRRSYRDAFIWVYVPVVICLPAWPRWILAGLPDPTFQQAAMLPIAAVFLFKGWKSYRSSRLDILVGAFVLLIGISECFNAGYSEAQNLMFDMLFSGFFPYLIARVVLQSPESRIQFLKVLIGSTCLVIVTAVYEMKFSYSPYRFVFDRFFPGQGELWVTTFRYGLTRVAGPYGHAILAGIIFMIALRLQCWAQGAKLWKPGVGRFNLGRVTKAQILTAWTFLGLCLTWVRGPQIGALLAWTVSLIGRGKKPKLRMTLALAALIFVGIPASYLLYAYVSVGRNAATSVAQESAAYRKELIDQYFSIAMQHPWLGWGRNTFPKLPTMPSIDNYYLLLALMHGVLVVALFLAILTFVCVRLFKTGVAKAAKDRNTSSLSFNLLGIYLGLAFSIGTVYMGENVIPVFFTLLGFTEAFLMANGRPKLQQVKAGRKVRAVAQPLKFRRIVA